MEEVYCPRKYCMCARSGAIIVMGPSLKVANCLLDEKHCWIYRRKQLMTKLAQVSKVESVLNAN